MKPRRASISDLACLMRLEADCFEPSRRVSTASMRHSLLSRHQEVWVIGAAGALRAVLMLHMHPHTCRILSIAVDPGHQGEGLGGSLIELARKRARKQGCRRIHLEADSRNSGLICWYERHGYRKARKLPNHYGTRWHAWRMRLAL